MGNCIKLYLRNPFFTMLKDGKMTACYLEITKHNCRQLCDNYASKAEYCKTCRYNYCYCEPKAKYALIALSGSSHIKDQRQLIMEIASIRKGRAPLLFNTSCYRQFVIYLKPINTTEL